MPAPKEDGSTFIAGSVELTDFVLTVGQYQWRVHSTMLSGASKFFERICNGPFRESSEKTVTLHDECPWIVGRMLQLHYFGLYFMSHTEARSTVVELNEIMKRGLGSIQTMPEEDIDEQRAPWEVNALLHMFAAKYECELLSWRSAEKISVHLVDKEVSLQEITEFFGITTLHHYPDLLKNCVEATLEAHFPQISVAHRNLKKAFKLNVDAMTLVQTILLRECDGYAQELQDCVRAREVATKEIRNVEEILKGIYP